MTAALETLPLQGPAFGQRLRAERRSRKLTQVELAAAAGISVMSVRSYEQGIRSPRDRSLLAMDAALSRFPVRRIACPDAVPAQPRSPNSAHMDDACAAMSAMPESGAALVALFAKFVLRGEAAFAGMPSGDARKK